MAERYAVATGNWTAANTAIWAASDGGAPGASVPTAADNVHFTALSGNITVTVLTNTALCANIDFTGFTGTFAGSVALTISGNATFASTGSWTYTGTITLNSTTSQTITSAGRVLASQVTFNGVAGSWALQDAFQNTGAATTLTNGTLNLNNQNLTTTTFASSNANARTITNGTGQFFITYAAGGTTTPFDLTTQTLLTVTDRMTINLSGANSGAVTRTLELGSLGESLAPDVNVTAGSDTVLVRTQIRNLVFSGAFTGTHANRVVTYYGNLTYLAGMTAQSGTNAITFGATSGTETITFAGTTIDCPVTFNGVGGTFQFGDAALFGSTRALTLTNGTLTDNGKTVSLGTFALGAGTKALTMSAVWTVQGSGASAWNANTNSAGLTLTTTGSSVSLNSSLSKTFAGGNSGWGTLIQSGTGILTVTGTNTFADMKWTANGLINLPSSVTTTVSAFSGPASAPGGSLASSTAGTKATLSKASGTVDVSNLSIKDSAAVGGASFFADLQKGNVNAGGDTGWRFGSVADGSAWKFLLGLGA